MNHEEYTCIHSGLHIDALCTPSSVFKGGASPEQEHPFLTYSSSEVEFVML